MNDEQTQLLQNIWQQMVALDRNLTAKIDHLGTSLGARLDKVDTRLDKVEHRLEKVEVHLDDLERFVTNFFAMIFRAFERFNGRFERIEVSLRKPDPQ